MLTEVTLSFHDKIFMHIDLDVFFVGKNVPMVGKNLFNFFYYQANPMFQAYNNGKGMHYFPYLFKNSMELAIKLAFKTLFQDLLETISVVFAHWVLIRNIDFLFRFYWQNII